MELFSNIIILDATKFFVSISNRNETKKNKKTEILMDKLACFGLSILKLSKILMYEFWYDYV